MAKRIFSFFLALSSVYFSSAAEVNVPKCNPGSNDPATNTACTNYGYDRTWIIKSGPKAAANRYITVDEGQGAGDKWPPPTVSVNVGERIRIRVENEMSENEEVTLHFHGILQKNGYVTMDGPQGITQSPIRVGEVFTYDFPVTQAGTFWIHSHATGQYPKGLRSPLIVKDASEPALMGYDAAYDFDITVSDWWDNFWTALDMYKNGTCAKGIEVPAQRQIVNDNVPEWGNPKSDSDLAKYIPAGKKARIRFINMSAFARYYIHLNTKNSNDFTVVEIDGVRIKPVQTQGIEVASGQRVSVLVNGVGESNESRKIIIVSDGRVSVPKVNASDDRCKAKFNNIPNGALSASVQYTWAWIDSMTGSPTRSPPNVVDMQYNGYNRNDWTTWTDADMYGKPFYSGRPRMDFADEMRPEVVNGVQVMIPKYAYNFNEFAFEPLTPEPAWMLSDSQLNKDYIHTLALTDYQDLGTMVRRLPGESAVLPATFPPVEAPWDPNQASTDFNRQHSLMQALRSVNGDGGTKNYEKPATYTHGVTQAGTEWAHTIVLPNADEVHWFILRGKRGDHPFHMHGHEFQLLAKLAVPLNGDGNPYDFDFRPETNYFQNVKNAVAALRTGSGGKDPARRDTLMIEKGWDYVIAIKTDNPGTWAMHCHNDFHADTGMFMQLIENPKALRLSLGVWDVGAQNQGTCGPCFQPWFSRSGTTSVNNGLGGTVWGPVAQNLRASMQYYGCPATCWQYYYSAISVRKRHIEGFVEPKRE